MVNISGIGVKSTAAKFYVEVMEWAVLPLHNPEGEACSCSRAECDRVGKHPHQGLIGKRPEGEGGVNAATKDAAQVEEWWQQNPDANIGIQTGQQSGLIVIDIDGPQGEKSIEGRPLPETIQCTTGRADGGRHLYFAYPESATQRIGNRTNLLPGVDVRADGGYVIAPPSVHASGATYQWTEGHAPLTMTVVDAPDWLMELLTTDAAVAKEAPLQSDDSATAVDNDDPQPEWLAAIISSNAEFQIAWNGQAGLPSLSEHRLSVAARLVALGLDDKLVIEGLTRFDLRHDRNPEPVETYRKELAKARSVAERQAPPAVSSTAATRMVKLVDEHVRRYYCDTDGKRYVRLAKDDQSDIYTLDTEDLRNWLSKVYYERYGDVPTTSAITNAMPVLKYRCDATPPCRVHVRLAAEGDTLYLDHRCDGEQVLAIAGGTVQEVTTPSSILFKRPKHMLPHGQIDLNATPQDVWRFLDVINAPADDDSRLLLLAWMVSGFLPSMARPLLVLTGPQGTAKSTAFRYLRSIIDPSSQAALAPPKSQADLNVVLNSTYFAPFDNVSSLTTLADPLCRVVTGESVSQRKLYTDEDIVSFTYQRLVAVNGIDIPVTQPDLLDRVLWLTLQPIPAERRKPESATDAAFEQVRPAIIGGCLNTIARVMQRPPFEAKRLPRLADWASFGASVARELGRSPESFLQAYEDVIAENREFALESRAFIVIVRELVEKHAQPEWTIRATDLLFMATEQAERYKLRYKTDPTWPDDPSWVTRRLNTSATDLEAAGITYNPRTAMPGRQKGIKFTNHNYAAPSSADWGLPSPEETKAEGAWAA